MSHWMRVAAMGILGLWAAGLTAGCSAAQERAPLRDAQAYTQNGKPVITVITKSLESGYWNMVQAGALLEGAARGYTIHLAGPNTEENVQAELDQIVAAQDDSAALVIAPSDPNSLVTTIGDAYAVGIPIVLVDSELADDSVYDAFVGTDNYKAGNALGTYVGEHQPGAKAAVITGARGSQTHEDRTDGILKGLEDNGCTVLEVYTADSDRNKAIAAARSLLEAYPDLTALIATSDDMALGAQQVVQSLGRSDTVSVYSFDATVEGIQAIAQGDLAAAAAQYPIQMGRDSIALADQILHGKPVEKRSETPYEIITADNAECFLDEIREQMTAAGMSTGF